MYYIVISCIIVYPFILVAPQYNKFRKPMILRFSNCV